MTSLWLDRPSRAPHPPLDGDHRSEVVVVGAGLTGLATALLLSRAGRDVVVLEARTIGAVATGNTTAKLSLLQGTQLSSIAHHGSADALRNYVEGNRVAQQWMTRYCTEHDVPFQTTPAFTYAQSGDAVPTARAELDAAKTAGLPVEWMDRIDTPVPNAGAVRLDGQAQFDPMDVLDALAEDAQRHGVRIHEHTRVTTVRGTSPTNPLSGTQVVRTDNGSVRTETVVLATGIPILDRGGFFARVEPQRSYALAFRVPGPIPRGMYLSADAPTRSLRFAPARDGELLLVGGSGHTVGRTESERRHVDELIRWTRRYFPGAELTHRWSAQDYRPVDGLPYVGPLLPGSDRILVATGYAKWGMTNAVAAAMILAARIGGHPVPWADAFSSWSTHELGALPHAAMLNGEVAFNMARGWLGAVVSTTASTPPEGGGVVGRRGARPIGVCTVEGVTSTVSAICPHLGGVLRWNDAERSWDCPLHGSRFGHQGELLEGPATQSLTNFDR